MLEITKTVNKDLCLKFIKIPYHTSIDEKS